jgi:hypothetical protein
MMLFIMHFDGFCRGGGLPKKCFETKSCFVGNPAIGFIILSGLEVTTNLSTPRNPIGSAALEVRAIKSAQPGYEKSALSILE